jgi:enamine deaminase RidA (YjgF/YER057c/UK114 family)
MVEWWQRAKLDANRNPVFVEGTVSTMAGQDFALAAKPALFQIAGNPRRNTMSKIEDRLTQLGIILPKASAPLANYVPTSISANLLIVSGQLCFGADGKLAPNHTGKVGTTISTEDAKDAARLCVLNVMAQAQAALGGFTRLRRCLRLGGFINAHPDFHGLAGVMNGASDAIVDIMGDAGRHARSTIGVAVLPLDACVEVEAMFEIA